jgi:hypothetical protein
MAKSDSKSTTTYQPTTLKSAPSVGRATGFIAAAVLAGVIGSAIYFFDWLRHAQPLPAAEISQIGVQLAPGAGFVSARLYDGSSYNLRHVTVRVFALRPKESAGDAARADGWRITSSRCTFDPVTKPVEYDFTFDRQIRFDMKLSPDEAAHVQAASDFTPGADYWECRIVGASGYK